MLSCLGALDEGLVALISLVDVCLVGDLPQRMHGEHGHAGVNHIHAVLGEDVGNGAAATCANAAKLAGLERNAGLVP